MVMLCNNVNKVQHISSYRVKVFTKIVAMYKLKTVFGNFSFF